MYGSLEEYERVNESQTWEATRPVPKNIVATDLEVTTDENGFELEVTTDTGELLVINVQDLSVLYALERGTARVSEYLDEGGRRLARRLAP